MAIIGGLALLEACKAEAKDGPWFLAEAPGVWTGGHQQMAALGLCPQLAVLPADGLRSSGISEIFAFPILEAS